MIKGGLNPLFSMRMINDRYQRHLEDVDRKALETLSFIGESFVNAARSTDTYKDQTSNLRSSIGYAVLKNGQIKKKDLQGTSKGKTRANDLLSELSHQLKKGWVLIGFAGMEYAASVESLGYDVITGSTPMATELLQTIINDLK